MDGELKVLAAEIETAETAAAETEGRIRAALRDAGLPQPWGLGSVDAVLGTVGAALPGWSVALDGEARAGHGHWSATLRRSRARDNDEALGVGHASHPAAAILAALFRALAAGARP